MRIQFLNGGLANQAFQYIFARSYELLHPGQIMYLDDSYFALHTVHNGYELEKVFGIRPHMLSECFDEEVWGFILQEREKGKSVPQILCDNGIGMYMIAEAGGTNNTFNPFDGRTVVIPANACIPAIWDLQDDVYYHGYWINKGWFSIFEEELRKEFCFPEVEDAGNKHYLEQIQNTDSVCLHVRRGDFVTVGWAQDPLHYRSHIATFMEENPGVWDLFVFSDDIPWCREHQDEIGMGMFGSVTFVEGNTRGRNYVDMQLMSCCKGMILSNSAFCYLAALLNGNGKKHIVNPTWREL